METKRVLAFRQFNRFYTDILGFLNEHIYDSPFSLTETRILYEIYNTADCTAKIIQERLDLDRGYVSRIVRKFEEEGFIYKQKCREDGRNHFLYVTASGESIYKSLEKKANQQVEYILERIDKEKQEKLVRSMETIQHILQHSFYDKESPISIRDYYTSEDVKNIIEKQRLFYAESHGWDDTFLSYLYDTFKADIEKIWVAESGNQFAGCIGLVNDDEKTGQLRWFLVDPSFQRKGVGSRLIKALVQYCKENGYERIFLWTVRDMSTARPLYKKNGFEITEIHEEKPLWGSNLIEERWDLEL